MLFLVIEGIDGSGGTTQARLLARWLRDNGAREVLETCEPSRGPVGTFIRRALDPSDPAASIGDTVLPYLFAADRRDHLDSEIVPALERGAVVVSDRYYHSSLAYQSLAIGMAAVAQLNAGFRAPDLTLFLDLDPVECLRRVQARGGARERFEALDRLRLVQDNYQSVLVTCRSMGERVARIDASGTVEKVHGLVVSEVQALMAARGLT